MFGRPGFSLDAARVYSNMLHGEEARAILEHIYHHSVVKVEIQVIMPSYIDLHFYKTCLLIRLLSFYFLLNKSMTHRL